MLVKRQQDKKSSLYPLVKTDFRDYAKLVTFPSTSGTNVLLFKKGWCGICLLPLSLKLRQFLSKTFFHF